LYFVAKRLSSQYRMHGRGTQPDPVWTQ